MERKAIKDWTLLNGRGKGGGRERERKGGRGKEGEREGRRGREKGRNKVKKGRERENREYIVWNRVRCCYGRVNGGRGRRRGQLGSFSIRGMVRVKVQGQEKVREGRESGDWSIGISMVVLVRIMLQKYIVEISYS